MDIMQFKGIELLIGWNWFILQRSHFDMHLRDYARRFRKTTEYDFWPKLLFRYFNNWICKLL